jgi:hypothetical protein
MPPYRDLVAATRHEMGLVAGAQDTHVAVPHLSGPVAKCGAGKIVQKVPGWFDPAAPSACAACAEQLRDAG